MIGRAPSLTDQRAQRHMLYAMVEENREGNRRRQGQHAAEQQCAATKRFVFQNQKGRPTVGTQMRRMAGKFGLDMEVLSRHGDRQIAEQIKPEPEAREKPCLVAAAVAEQLQGLLAIRCAKPRRIQAEKPSVDLLRHTAPSKSSWSVPRATGPQVSRPPSAPVCVPPKSAGNTGVAPCRVLRLHEVRSLR